MTRSLLAIGVAMLLLPGCGDETLGAGDQNDDRYKADFYGRDDRRDPFDLSPQHPALTWARATALKTSKRQISCGPDECSLKAESLREAAGICPSVPFAAQPSLNGSSAFLVASDLMLTTAHGATVPLEEWCDERVFVFGYAYRDRDQTFEDVTRVPKNDVYYCREIVAYQYDKDIGDPNDPTDDRPLADFALIRLDRAVQGRQWLALASGEPLPPGSPVLMIGHPEGIPQKVAFGSIVDWPANRPWIVTDLDSLTGNSGSVVLDAQTGRVIGLHAGSSGVNYDYASQLEHDCQVQQFCDRVNLSAKTCYGSVELSSAVFAPFLPDKP